jgi:hypothetical protein
LESAPASYHASLTAFVAQAPFHPVMIPARLVSASAPCDMLPTM